MKTRNVMIASAVAGLALVGGLSLAAPDWQAVRPTWAAVGEGHGKHFGRHGPGHRLGRLCSERREERLADLVGLVESFVDFTPEQDAAWRGLTAALDSGSDRIGAACSDLKTAGRPETAPDRLARLETLLAAGLDAVREVRPAFEGFYASLDDQQKAAVDRLARHHRR